MENCKKCKYFTINNNATICSNPKQLDSELKQYCNEKYVCDYFEIKSNENNPQKLASV